MAPPIPAVSIPTKAPTISMSREQEALLQNPLDPRVNAMLQKPAQKTAPNASNNGEGSKQSSDLSVNMLDGL